MNNKPKFVLVLTVLMLIFLPTTALFAFDPLESRQWYLDRTNVKKAWEKTTGSPEVIVAVLDTGVDLNQLDLKDNLWTNTDEIAGAGVDNDKHGYIDDVNGWNFMAGNNLPEPSIAGGYFVDAVDHGTFVSGIISAIHDNNLGVKGVTARVKIMPIVVLDAYGYGDSNYVAAGINYAIDNGAQVINLSFGGPDYNESLKAAIKRANANNVVIVAAAGNSIFGGMNFNDQKVYPICYDEEFDKNMIVGVASTDRNDVLSYFSNYGDYIDIVAPGEDFVGISFTDEQNSDFQSLTVSNYRGTSFASALVSGTVALMKSIKRSLSSEDVIKILQETAVNIDSKNLTYKGGLGGGLLNTSAAVDGVYSFLLQSNQLKIIAAADQTYSTLKVFDADLKYEKQITVFDDSFKGLNVSGADLNADDKTDLIVGATAGSQPLVRGLTLEENLLSSFLAFENTFRGGVRATAGDINGDGSVEYVAVPQSGRKPQVRIFDNQGKLLKEFLAFDAQYTGGFTVAVGNVIGDAKKEIIVGAPKGSVPEVKIFDEKGNLLKKFNAFGVQFTGGVNLTVANVDGANYDEIVVGAGAGGGPQVRIFNADASVKGGFFAYNMNFRGGVRVAASDINGDGVLEIITTPGVGGGPHLRVFSIYGALINELFVFGTAYSGGTQVTVID
jgi:hypothetical protein